MQPGPGVTTFIGCKYACMKASWSHNMSVQRVSIQYQVRARCNVSFYVISHESRHSSIISKASHRSYSELRCHWQHVICPSLLTFLSRLQILSMFRSLSLCNEINTEKAKCSCDQIVLLLTIIDFGFMPRGERKMGTVSLRLNNNSVHNQVFNKKNDNNRKEEGKIAHQVCL